MNIFRLKSGNYTNQKFNGSALLTVVLGLVCFGFLSATQAVIPAPDGGYPGGNTAEGQNALFSLTTGSFNTAVGFLSLRSNTAGELNTAIGAGALLANVGDPSSSDGFENTAIGAGALLSNSTGSFNTANGVFALFNNTTGVVNTAIGDQALQSNTVGAANTATGTGALANNTTGNGNTATGRLALVHNTTGTGNIALGDQAGLNVTTASNVICIGSTGFNVNNSCFITEIRGAPVSPDAVPVLVDSSDKLGTMTSSRRFKEDIKPMDKASEALFALKPVSFRYKKDIDPAGISQLGLVAEDVEKVNPDLIVRDKNGKPYSVRYDQVNAMLLNEFLKEHKAFVEEHRKVEQLEKQVEALSAGLQKVSAQLAPASPSLVDSN